MKILDNVSLSPFTTFKLGGKARYFTAVETKEDLIDAVRWSKQTGTPYMVIGEGSNILVSDDGFSGLIIRNQISGLENYEKNEETYLGVGSGENWDDFVALTVKKGLYGIENLSGIPGSVGATPIQNIGAYGRDVGSVISWVEALNTETMEVELLTNNQCQFDYRDSLFKKKEGSKYIVTEVGFKLSSSGIPNISYRDLTNYFNNNDVRPSLESVRNAVLNIRAGKFPDLNHHGCGGSFFKNPVITRNQLRNLQSKFKDMPHYSHENGTYKIPLAWVLEHAVPWKGVRRKTVGVSELQPLVLIHYGGGSANEIKRLAEDITKSVSNKTNILISPEVCFVGDF